MARAAGWSWLPCDLLNQVADNLLATGDVDCYLNLRAVCHNWRDAIAAPCGHDDPRFLPRGWVMLDSDARNARGLFLNVDTGRLLLKDLPSLRDCAFVATDDNGLLILHGPTPSKNFSALNPFTSASISFPQQYPAFALHDLVVAAGTSPKVMLHIFQDQERATLLDLNSEFTNQWSFPAGPALEFFDSVVSCQGCVYNTPQTGTEQSRSLIATGGSQPSSTAAGRRFGDGVHRFSWTTQASCWSCMFHDSGTPPCTSSRSISRIRFLV
jgi:hypothetical protein